MQPNVGSSLPVVSMQIGDWSTPMNHTLGLRCASQVVAAALLKPAVTMMSKPWSTKAWMFLMYSEASFGTTDLGAAAFRSVAPVAAPLNVYSL